MERLQQIGLIGVIACSTILSCVTSKDRAANEARKADKARQKEMAQLQKVRVELPCDPVKIIEGKTVYLPGDSIPYPVYINGDTVIKWAKCSPSKSRVDTFIKIDQAALKAVRDSADHWAYLFGVATDSYADLSKENKGLKAQVASLKPWKTWGIVILSGLSAAGIFFGVFKLKSLFL